MRLNWKHKNQASEGKFLITFLIIQALERSTNNEKIIENWLSK
jgi:hypothetical protein